MNLSSETAAQAESTEYVGHAVRGSRGRPGRREVWPVADGRGARARIRVHGSRRTGDDAVLGAPLPGARERQRQL